MKKFSIEENLEMLNMINPITTNLIKLNRKLENHSELQGFLLDAIVNMSKFCARMADLQQEPDNE